MLEKILNIAQAFTNPYNTSVYSFCLSSHHIILGERGKFFQNLETQFELFNTD